MNKKQLMHAADRTYNELQGLGIQPTKTNLTIIMRALQTLEYIYKYLQEVPEEPETGEESADV